MNAVQKFPKIALVVPSLAQGGGVPAVARFIKNTIQRSGRYDLKLVSLSTSSRDPYSLNFSQPTTWRRGATINEGVWDDFPYVHVGAVGGELEFRRYKSRKVLTDVLADCNIIQVVCGSAAWANTVVGLGKPVSLQVATRVKIERHIRDANPKDFAGWWRKGMTQISDKLDDQALRAVDAIQLENPWMLNYAQHINRDRSNVDIRYAPPGVNAELFVPLSERPILANPYILFVGRLDDPRKNPLLLLDAFQRISANLEKVHLVTAGSGRPPPEYWAKVEALELQDRVRHVHRPETKDLVKLYQQATAFALSSNEEGLGVVLLEAMACGIPVVATRCGGPDGIISDGKDGFLVPLDDAVVMADRLTVLCTDVKRNHQMGINARATIEARYADNIADQAFLNIWNDLLKNSEKK